MSETLALPPASTAGDTSAKLDLEAFADALASTPMEDYSPAPSATAPEPPKPAPEPAPGPGGADAPKGEGSGPAPEPAPEKRNVESARELVEGYDLLQSYGFSALSDGMKPEAFALEKFPKDRAVHHLAKGLEKMGSPEIPWWFGLVLALAIPAFINYRIAIGHRKGQAQQRTQRNRSASGNGQPLSPDSITDRNGQRVDVPPPAAPPPAAPAAAREEIKPPAMRVVRNYGPCKVCGNPVHRKNASYCGKSCSGKALNERMRAQREAQP